MVHILRDRLMVGHLPLKQSILVRVQVPQQKNITYVETMVSDTFYSRKQTTAQTTVTADGETCYDVTN
jgi:hypothetical protein